MATVHTHAQFLRHVDNFESADQSLPLRIDSEWEAFDDLVPDDGTEDVTLGVWLKSLRVKSLKRAAKARREKRMKQRISTC